MVALVPPGPGAPSADFIRSMYEAVRSLLNPGGPVQLAHVATVAELTGKYPADDYRGGVLICDEINSLVHATSVAGTYAWLRADGSAL